MKREIKKGEKVEWRCEMGYFMTRMGVVASHVILPLNSQKSRGLERLKKVGTW